MSALMINDLSRAHELSRKEMASVSGGSVFQNMGINNI
ncbi:bacteriocin, partial [Burkholderia stagnalis]